MPAEGYGARLQRLRKRSGVRVGELSAAIGAKTDTTYRNYENEKRYVDTPIPAHIVMPLFSIMVGRGEPPVTAEELLNLSEMRGIQRFLSRVASPLACGEALELPSTTGALIVRHHLALGVYRDSNRAMSAGPGLVSRVLPSSQYPQQQQWAVVVDDTHGQPFGILQGSILTCVCVTALPPNAVPPGSVVVVQHKRNDLIEFCLAKVTAYTARGGIQLKSPDDKAIDADVLGVALQCYGPVPKQTP
jgi:hypothetical protein